MSSGVGSALYTRFLGASKSRVIRICVSVGSVTTAVRLLVIAIMFLLVFLQFFQDDIQPIEALRPRAFIVLHPVRDRRERRALEPVESLAPMIPYPHHPHFPQHSQVLGH